MKLHHIFKYNFIIYLIKLQILIFEQCLFFFIYKYPISVAIENGNANIVNLLLSHPKIDVNSQYIFFSSFITFIYIFKFHFINKFI